MTSFLSPSPLSPLCHALTNHKSVCWLNLGMIPTISIPTSWMLYEESTCPHTYTNTHGIREREREKGRKEGRKRIQPHHQTLRTHVPNGGETCAYYRLRGGERDLSSLSLLPPSRDTLGPRRALMEGPSCLPLLSSKGASS